MHRANAVGDRYSRDLGVEHCLFPISYSLVASGLAKIRVCTDDPPTWAG